MDAETRHTERCDQLVSDLDGLGEEWEEADDIEEARDISRAMATVQAEINELHASGACPGGA